jgi:dipeptidyl aminopeptidase/acylaminoacyl peptidase
VPSDGGTARDLTPGKWSVGAGELRGGASIDWTPDSKAIVFDGSKSPDADVQYEASQLYVVDLASGTVRDLVAKAGNWGRPVVSPDGRTVAFTGHPPTGRSYTVSDLFVTPLTGGGSDMRKISGDFDRDPINMRWAPDGTGLYFDADASGARNVQFASIVGGVKPVTTGRHMLTFDSVSKDLVAAGTSSDLHHPQDVVKFSLKTPGPVTTLTDVSGDVLQGKQLAKIEEVTYTMRRAAPRG